MFINLNRFKTSRLAKAISSLFLDFTATNTLDDRVTFSRTSNATVTNSAGLIAYAPHNLYTFSEQFDNAVWIKTRSSITANATLAPNGTATADKLVENTDNSTHIFQLTLSTSNITSGLTYTYSVYAKAGERSFFEMQFGNDFSVFTTSSATFNLNDGTISGQTGTATYTSTSVGNGWYRLTGTATAAATNLGVVRCFLKTDASNSSYLGNGTSGLFLWGAQLEIGSTATTYNSTTVKNLLGFTQEFDNAAWTKSNSFVQTNLVLRSEEFDNASWSTAALTISANDIVSPNGYQNAEALIETTAASAFHFSQQTITKAASAIQYTFSIYVKAKGRLLGISVASGSGGAVCRFNPATGLFTQTAVAYGTWSAQSSTATLVGNGWYRVVLVGTSDTATSFAVQVSTYNEALNTNVYTGDGVSGFYLWGAQLVQGAVAGDYVRTSSTVMPVMYQSPTGTLSADKLVEDSATAAHFLQSATLTAQSGTAYTFSCYAKAGERSKFELLGFALGLTGRGFDLSNGTTFANTAGLSEPTSFSITSVGNGWYRCSITANGNGLVSTVRAYLNNGTTFSYAGNGTSGIYIWGAQLSDSASLDPYVYNPVAALTAAAYYGARFDYDPVKLQPKGLLIEEQRSNLLTYSEQFDNAAWTKTGLVATVNDTTAPTGTNVAEKLTLFGLNTEEHALQSIAVTAGTSYTFSAYLKAGTRSNVALGMRVAPLWPASLNQIVDFNLSNGTATINSGSATFSITNVGNGWYRCTITSTAVASGTAQFRVQATSSVGETTYFYAWGAQLEAGSFATSYIPTAASQVTRAADTAIIQGSNFSSWFNPNAGTTYSDYFPAVIGTVYALDDSSYSNRCPQASVGTAFFVTNGTVVASLGTSLSANQNIKTSTAYAFNDYALVNNGATPSVDTSGALPSGISRLILGADSGLSTRMNGTIKSFSYYPTRLSNATLQSITS